MAQSTSLTDLPPDILYIVFPYLTATEFLNLTSSNKTLVTYREDPTFWHTLTRKTFRIPPQPLLQGARWQWLYKKLLTQTRLYTWGDNKSGNLGHGDSLAVAATREIHGHRAGRGYSSIRRGRPAQSGYPRPAVIPDDLGVGIVADVQCGGWSTLILNSIGAIYMFGIFDGLRYINMRESPLRRLGFPPGYPPTTKDRYEPSTAIKQFSTGRSSVLGLSDDGKVWMWESDICFQVKPIHVDLIENSVERVVAGWDRNSMYVVGIGIIYWTSIRDSDIVRGGRQVNLEVNDTMLIETVTIPGTGYRRNKNDRNIEDTLESRIGQVTNHVVCSDHIIFTTDLNKVFCYRTTFPMPALDVPEPSELITFYDALPDQTFKIRDLQGAFTRFAVFTESGSVLTNSDELLNAYSDVPSASLTEPSAPLPPPTLIPSLQSGNIISLAFGDHHFHALHADGTITSYGQEPQRCGALGLGNRSHSLLRGVRARPGFGGGDLPDDEGRTVWFEPLMETWLSDTARSTEDNEEAKARRDMLNTGHPGAREAFANHFENEGAKWENDVTQDGEVGAYFVLKVAAAGWHSAALVLVDEEKAEAARENHIVRPKPPTQTNTRDPSPAPSMQSTSSYGEREYIESPFDQVADVLHAVYHFVWSTGRWFLGLTERDAAREAAAAREQEQRRERVNSGEETEAGERPLYTWSQRPFARLRLPDGEVMPGEIGLTE